MGGSRFGVGGDMGQSLGHCREVGRAGTSIGCTVACATLDIACIHRNFV